MATKRIIAHNAKVLAPFKDFNERDWEEIGLAFGLTLRVIRNNFIPLEYDVYIGKIDKDYVLPDDRVYHDGWLFKVWTPTANKFYYGMYVDGAKVYRLNSTSRMWNYNWKAKNK